MKQENKAQVRLTEKASGELRRLIELTGWPVSRIVLAAIAMYAKSKEGADK